VGENICQLHIRQRTNNQNIQELKKLNSPKINEPIKKWEKVMEIAKMPHY
jgi:hypothetical protein